MGCGLGTNNERNKFQPPPQNARKEIIKIFQDHYISGLNDFIQFEDSTRLQTCKHKDMKQEFALKLIPKKRFENNTEIERFIEEMGIIKEMNHPNILKIYDVLQDGENYCIVNEICYEKTVFEKLLSKGEKLTEVSAAKIMKQLLSALTYCHSKNILHRDLRPEKLHFRNETDFSNYQIVVRGFGTSRIFNPNKKENFELNYFYLAPETLKGISSEKSDVWSCGAILYTLLSGFNPFMDMDEERIIDKISNGIYSFEGIKISREAQNLINLMLTLDPQQRCTAQEALHNIWINKMAQNEKYMTQKEKLVIAFNEESEEIV